MALVPLVVVKTISRPETFSFKYSNGELPKSANSTRRVFRSAPTKNPSDLYFSASSISAMGIMAAAPL